MGSGNSKLTLEEQLRSNRREINRSIRELDRERIRLENEERKLIQDIRTSAEKGEMASTRIMAKNLVRTRRHLKKFYEMRSQLQAVNLRLQTVKSTQAMAESMKGVAKVMVRMNRQLDIPALQKVMANFMRESEKLGLTEEMMSDVVDEGLGDEADEEEEDAVVQQVLEEIGVDLSGKISSAPSRLPDVGTSVTKQTPVPAAALVSQNNGISQSNVGANNPTNNEPVTTSASAPSGSNGQNLTDMGKSLEERLKNLKT